MANTGVKNFIFTKNGGAGEQIIVRANYQRETELMIGSVKKNTAAKMVQVPFRNGAAIRKQKMIDWATTNNYSMQESGNDTQPPYLVSTAINGGKTVITVTFNEKINGVGNAAATKAGILFATDGVTFNALGSSDTINAVDGTSNILTITLSVATVTTTNKVKVLVNTIKDAAGNKNALLVSTAV